MEVTSERFDGCTAVSSRRDPPAVRHDAAAFDQVFVTSAPHTSGPSPIFRNEKVPAGSLSSSA